MKKEYRIAVAGTGYVGLSIAAPTNVYLQTFSGDLMVYGGV